MYSYFNCLFIPQRSSGYNVLNQPGRLIVRTPPSGGRLGRHYKLCVLGLVKDARLHHYIILLIKSFVNIGVVLFNFESDVNCGAIGQHICILQYL